jgi:hypothetical protein
VMVMQTAAVRVSVAALMNRTMDLAAFAVNGKSDKHRTKANGPRIRRL